VPENCPCPTGSCTLSRLTAGLSGDHHTLDEIEAAVDARVSGLPVDLPAMAAVGNLYRAAGAVRNRFERTVLAPHDLTWTAWVVLWVVWIWEDIETRHLAEEAGISKGTLTGVTQTLISKGLVDRRKHPDDGRRVLVSLTASGRHLMRELFPVFNAAEASVVQPLTADEIQAFTTTLRKIVLAIEAQPQDLG
jgi:DNA-binding MarR family transcriptional regulator